MAAKKKKRSKSVKVSKGTYELHVTGVGVKPYKSVGAARDALKKAKRAGFGAHLYLVAGGKRFTV